LLKDQAGLAKGVNERGEIGGRIRIKITRRNKSKSGIRSKSKNRRCVHDL
jgi:hypothetical protein